MFASLLTESTTVTQSKLRNWQQLRIWGDSNTSCWRLPALRKYQFVRKWRTCSRVARASGYLVGSSQLAITSTHHSERLSLHSCLHSCELAAVFLQPKKCSSFKLYTLTFSHWETCKILSVFSFCRQLFSLFQLSHEAGISLKTNKFDFVHQLSLIP